MKSTWITGMWLCVLATSTPVNISNAEDKLFTFSEFFRLEDIHAVAISPIGDSAAFVRSRGRAGTERYLGGRLSPHEREDVWLVDLGDLRKVKPLTQGAIDGSSYWEPLWSPDGKRLLILTDQGFDNLHLDVIDIRSGRRTRVSQRGIDREVDISAPQLGAFGRVLEATNFRPMSWVDTNHVIFAELSSGDVSTVISHGTRQVERVSAEWQRTEEGTAPSFSRLDSERKTSSRAGGRLVMMDVGTGESRQVAEGAFRKVMLSPDGKFAAILGEGAPKQLDASNPAQWLYVRHAFQTTRNFRTTFSIARLTANPTVESFPAIIDPTFDSIPYGERGPSEHGVVQPAPGTAAGFAEVETYYGPIWLATQGKVVLLASAEESRARSDILFIVDAEHGSVNQVAHPGVTVRDISVVGDSIFVRATKEGVALYNAKGKDDWYSVTGTSILRITQGDDCGNGSLIALTRRIGIAVDPKFGSVCIVIPGKPLERTHFDQLVGSTIVWPTGSELTAVGTSVILLQQKNGSLEQLVPTKRAIEVRPFAAPLLGDYMAFDPGSSSLFAVNRSESGTTLEMTIGKERAWRRVVTLNEFLDRLYVPTFIDLRYQAQDGRETGARLFLPSGYREGVKVPLITWVYIAMRSDQRLSNNNASFENMALAMQYGYAVLVPTINTAEYGFSLSPYASLPRDVVPAVKAAISSGVVDGRRVYLYGHSYGAYAAYSLIEQTDLFAAAAVINGPSNLLDLYLDVDPNTRHYAYPFEASFNVQGELENEHPYISLGATPWSDFDRYLQNSPIRHIDHIHTPLLIVHSDTDTFEMHQADNMFAGLVRLGKEARYIRFWGEPHSLDSPANIRQFWTEVIGWFGEHSRTPE